MTMLIVAKYVTKNTVLNVYMWLRDKSKMKRFLA